MKVDLRYKPDKSSLHVPGHLAVPVKKIVPFYKSTLGTHVHRIRYAHNHWRQGVYSHCAMTLWCGNCGLAGGRGREAVRLLADPPADAIFCSMCEVRTTLAGLPGAAAILKREVKFSSQV